jgi:hypothetical protein
VQQQEAYLFEQLVLSFVVLDVVEQQHGELGLVYVELLDDEFDVEQQLDEQHREQHFVDVESFVVVDVVLVVDVVVELELEQPY